MSYPQPLSLESTPVEPGAFKRMCDREDYHLLDVMRGLCACQKAIEEQLAGSDAFRLAEQHNVRSDIQKLAQVSHTLKKLCADAGCFKSGQVVPEALVTELDVARETIGRFRAVMIHNHVFHKINDTLVKSKTGIVNKLAEATEMTKDLCIFVENHPRPALPK